MRFNLNNSVFSTHPEDFTGWVPPINPPALCLKSSHFCKCWGFDPDKVSHYLINPDCQEAGDYPIASNKDTQMKKRSGYLHHHNRAPQFLAKSTFPAPYYVARCDEASVQGGDCNTKEDHKVITWLVDDFIVMFFTATGLTLYWPKDGEDRVDREIIEKRLEVSDDPPVKHPKRKFKHGDSYCLYCHDCWKAGRESPVCFVQVQIEGDKKKSESNEGDAKEGTEQPENVVDDEEEQAVTEDQVPELVQPVPENDDDDDDFQTDGYVKQDLAPPSKALKDQILKNLLPKAPQLVFPTKSVRQLGSVHGPATGSLPDYHKSPLEFPDYEYPEGLDEYDFLPEHRRENELMVRSERYSHISLKVTHLYYHSHHCCSKEDNDLLPALKNNEMQCVNYNFDFVHGPILDQPYEQLNSIPLHTVLLGEQTKTEDIPGIMDAYELEPVGKLYSDPTGIPVNAKNENKRHDNFLKKQQVIEDSDERASNTDRSYTLGPFHKDEGFNIGKNQWLVSNARRLYVTVALLGAVEECAPFIFNRDLYVYKCVYQKRIGLFNNLWLNNKKHHILLDSVALIFGGNEKLADSAIPKNQQVHCDNSLKDGSSWEPGMFPGSPGLAPYQRRILVHHPEDNLPVNCVCDRGQMLLFNGDVPHCGKTHRGAN